MVVVLGLAAYVDQPVDRGGTADHPAAGIDDGPSVGAGIGLGTVFPGQGRVVEHFEKTRRNVDERVPVAATRLDQHDFRRRIFGQPIRQHAAGRPRPDDDIICSHVLPSLRRWLLAADTCGRYCSALPPRRYPNAPQNSRGYCYGNRVWQNGLSRARLTA